MRIFVQKYRSEHIIFVFPFPAAIMLFCQSTLTEWNFLLCRLYIFLNKQNSQFDFAFWKCLLLNYFSVNPIYQGPFFWSVNFWCMLNEEPLTLHQWNFDQRTFKPLQTLWHNLESRHTSHDVTMISFIGKTPRWRNFVKHPKNYKSKQWLEVSKLYFFIQLLVKYQKTITQVLFSKDIAALVFRKSKFSKFQGVLEKIFHFV